MGECDSPPFDHRRQDGRPGDGGIGVYSPGKLLQFRCRFWDKHRDGLFVPETDVFTAVLNQGKALELSEPPVRGELECPEVKAAAASRAKFLRALPCLSSRARGCEGYRHQPWLSCALTGSCLSPNVPVLPGYPSSRKPMAAPRVPPTVTSQRVLPQHLSAARCASSLPPPPTYSYSLGPAWSPCAQNVLSALSTSVTGLDETEPQLSTPAH